jgi:predicted nucleotidyltransferase component of viral defense system
LLEERFVDHYAQSSGVDAIVAERDIVLTYVLEVLCENLTGKLAFKGGTCLKKVYLGKTGRFSMDLDFTGVHMTPKSFREKFTKLFDHQEYFGIRFEVLEEYSRPEETSHGSILQYSHDWNSGSKFKVETSFRETPILHIVERHLIKELYFRYCEIKPFKVICLQLEELLAEKLRAAFQRLRVRDLYDLYLFSKKPYDKSRVRSLAVVKCWNARDPFDPKRLFQKIENARYDWSDLQSLVRAKSLPNEEIVIKTVLNNYSYLKELNETLTHIIKDSKSHRQPSLVDALRRKLSG